jgi:hypothetical protein
MQCGGDGRCVGGGDVGGGDCPVGGGVGGADTGGEPGTDTVGLGDGLRPGDGDRPPGRERPGPLPVGRRLRRPAPGGTTRRRRRPGWVLDGAPGALLPGMGAAGLLPGGALVGGPAGRIATTAARAAMVAVATPIVACAG